MHIQRGLLPVPPCRRIAASMLAGIAILQAGCVTAPPRPPTGHQIGLGKVAVVAAIRAPEVKFEGFPHGKGEGAASAAGSTFGACIGGIRGGCSGEFCGAAVILWLGVCSVAGAIGGIAGATTTPASTEVSAAEESLTGVVDGGTIQQSLQAQVAKVAAGHGASLVSIPPTDGRAAVQTGDFRPLGADGADHVLEVGLTRVTTEGEGLDAPLQLSMEVHARLVRTSDNREIFSSEYACLGERLRLSEWSSNQAVHLLHALQLGYENLASHIYDSIFMLYPFPDRDAHATGFLSASFGLAPTYPSTRGQLTGDKWFGSHFEWTAVDDLWPTLRWQSFPREGDIKAAPEDMTRVRRVRYDLLVAREHNAAPAEIVYRVEGLPEASHTLGISLDSDTRYFWTVRARFELDGRERVTEWGSTHFMAFGRIVSPSPFSYRFKTP